VKPADVHSLLNLSGVFDWVEKRFGTGLARIATGAIALAPISAFLAPTLVALRS